jgi:hypothetical protein
MNNVFQKLLALCLVAGNVASAGAAEKVWNFDSLDEVAPPLWAKSAKPGFVDGGKDISCEDGKFTYTLNFTDGGRCYFGLKFDEPLDAKTYHILKFRFYSPVSGRIQLFYTPPDGGVTDMDRLIEVAEGWNEYEVDLNDMTFGTQVHSEEDMDKQYQRWGGELQQVSWLRIDTWFPKGTTVMFDFIKLSDGQSE